MRWLVWQLLVGVTRAVWWRDRDDGWLFCCWWLWLWCDRDVQSACGLFFIYRLFRRLLFFVVVFRERVQVGSSWGGRPKLPGLMA